MGGVYVSYKSEDRYLVDLLAPRLVELGHVLSFDQMLYAGAAWREQLMEGLLASDVMLLLWSENTTRSQYVAAEVGAVRASARVGLVPVIVGDVAIPPFIQDVLAARFPDTAPGSVDALVEELDRAIRLHIAHRDAPKAGRPKIFISHRHKDEPIVAALIDCLDRFLEIERSDIRCTSVVPYRLPVGENTSDRLRAEISDAEVVLGILTTDTLESSYVAFELGSAWGQQVWTCPLLARGATQANIPDPIRDLAPLFLTEERDCRQLLADLADMTTLQRRPRGGGRPLDERIATLMRIASGA